MVFVHPVDLTQTNAEPNDGKGGPLDGLRTGRRTRRI